MGIPPKDGAELARIGQVWGGFRADPAASGILRRNGRIHLLLPRRREAARRALALYQPQRSAACAGVAAVRVGCAFGLSRFLAKPNVEGTEEALEPPLPEVEAGTLGALLGSPEHAIPRLIASYRHRGSWEVAKIAFGPAGAAVIERESGVLRGLGAKVPGAPSLLGVHVGDGFALMRLPYLDGRAVKKGCMLEPLTLLNDWIGAGPPKPIEAFDEWPAIRAALLAENAADAVATLRTRQLRPVLQHGDFARWNLRQVRGGGLTVLDWEWGNPSGLPGIDLVHYLIQDAWLVDRFAPEDVIAGVLRRLKEPNCSTYLEETGWRGDPLLPVIACLAYKQGAGHQQCGDLLRAALST